MKSFRNFVNEKTVKVPSVSQTLGIPRKDMPQIFSGYADKFMKFLRSNGVAVTKVSKKATELKASQRNFDKTKVAAMMNAIDSISMEKPIFISKDNYILDGHHRWLAGYNLDLYLICYQIDCDAHSMISLAREFPQSSYKSISESTILLEDDNVCEIITQAQMKKFEALIDKVFKKFDIDFDFTKHFNERMSDSRNKPCISIKELAEFLNKVYRNKGKKIKAHKDAQVVIKDLQRDLNIPVVVDYDHKNDEFKVVMKTIMRKKKFSTPDTVVKYE